MSTKDLRENTYPEHQASERKLLVALEGITNKEEYVRLLNCLYGFYVPIENRIRYYLTKDVFPDIDKRCRSEYLISDILEAGVPLPLPDICTQLPVINSFASALGALYVLEGNTMGGRIIATMLSSLLGASCTLAFFNSYATEPAPVLESFNEYLNRSVTHKQWEEITYTATQTFISFKNWIDKHELQHEALSR